MVSFLSTNSYSGRSKASKLFFDLAVAMNDVLATTAAIVSGRCFISLQISILHPFRLQCFGRLGRVVLNRTDIPVAGLRQWATVEVRFIKLA